MAARSGKHCRSIVLQKKKCLEVISEGVQRGFLSERKGKVILRKRAEDTHKRRGNQQRKVWSLSSSPDAKHAQTYGLTHCLKQFSIQASPPPHPLASNSPGFVLRRSCCMAQGEERWLREDDGPDTLHYTLLHYVWID